MQKIFLDFDNTLVESNKRIIEIEGTYTGKTKLFSCAKLMGYELNNMFNILISVFNGMT